MELEEDMKDRGRKKGEGTLQKKRTTLTKKENNSRKICCINRLFFLQLRDEGGKEDTDELHKQLLSKSRKSFWYKMYYIWVTVTLIPCAFYGGHKKCG